MSEIGPETAGKNPGDGAGRVGRSTPRSPGSPNDDDLWADLEAAPVHFWYGAPEMGLWCPICNLPSGWRLTFSSDPADPVETGGLELYGCEDQEGHGSAVRDEALP